MLQSLNCALVFWIPEGAFFGKSLTQGWYYSDPKRKPVGPYVNEGTCLLALADHLDREVDGLELTNEIDPEEARLSREYSQKVRAAVTGNCCDKDCGCES